MGFHFSRVSTNAKTGPIPVSTSSAETCPDACSFKGSGCYAEAGPLALHWRKVSDGSRGSDFNSLLDHIRALPKGQLWRHNQAGDLPGLGDAIDAEALGQLVRANRGRRGFTYTHKPITEETCGPIAAANREGFTINLSADNLAQADRLAGLGIAPVVVVLPSDQTAPLRTPEGRKVAICPAVLSDNVTCASCGLCAEVGRKSIIGFPAHGTSKAKASRVAALPEIAIAERDRRRARLAEIHSRAVAIAA